MGNLGGSGGAQAHEASERVARKEMVFTAAGAGLQGATTDVFTITGAILVRYLLVYCTTTLTDTEGAPTLSLGHTNNVDHITAVTTASGILAGEFWHADPAVADTSDMNTAFQNEIYEENIVIDVANPAGNIDAGAITFTMYWHPITSDGNVVSA